MPTPIPFNPILQASGNDFSYLIRPIQKDDKQRLISLFNHLSPENRYLRFAHAIAKLPDAFLEDVLELDYQKEMALVAVSQPPLEEEIIGIARYVSEANPSACEFSLTVGDDYAAHGVGTNLMRALTQYAKLQGIEQMIGYVLNTNSRMLFLVSELGFEITRTTDNPEFKKVILNL